MHLKMKNFNLKVALPVACVAVMGLGSLLMSAAPGTDIMEKNGTTTVVNTTLLGKDVRGFKGQTPVKIYIVGGKVQRIEALKNQDTPQFFNKAKALLAKFEGLTVKKASKLQVDGVSGATFSSKALKKNVELGLDYYQKHK